MTKKHAVGLGVLLAVVTSLNSTRLWAADAQNGGCNDYPIALYPDPVAESVAEAELEGLAPGADMVWHPARGTFWFVTLSVPLPQCGAQDNVFTHLNSVVNAHRDLFQVDLAEWKTPPSVPCASVGQVPQVLKIERARVGSHPIARDLMTFTVQRVNGVVALIALTGEYLPSATPWLDAELAACPDLDEELASEVVLDSHFAYSIFRLCAYIGAGVYSPNALDWITFEPTVNWTWNEDPVAPRVLFTKSTAGKLLLNPVNHTRKLVQSDANCPAENGQPRIGFRLTMDSVTADLASYTPGLNCIVCLR